MRKLHEANFIYLLIGLLAVLIIAPIIVEFTNRPAGLIIEFGFVATLIIGIWSLVESRLWFRSGLALVIAAAAVAVGNFVWPSALLRDLDLVIVLVFCAMSLVFALKCLFRTPRMDINSVFGAICIYLLFGVQLAILNLLAYRQIPGAFAGLAADSGANEGLNLIYYSFVTLTTLGYGDITPATPAVKALAYLGAVTGQFYIAILVALVIGMYLNQQAAHEKPRHQPGEK